MSLVRTHTAAPMRTDKTSGEITNHTGVREAWRQGPYTACLRRCSGTDLLAEPDAEPRA